MRKRKKSFFERLTGAVNTNSVDDGVEMEVESDGETKNIRIHPEKETSTEDSDDWLEKEEGQLTVDVYQNPDEVVIRTMVAGVRPDTLDIQISRDMVTIRGTRQSSSEDKNDDYLYRELYWGTFSRTILLPTEVDVEEADAVEEHGLLTLRLPKIDKERKTKLRVKSSK
ncbi:MAG TPA: Hsp20/alpha crystallin family protein [Candidatus Paceibacterota bacterium]|jgi:HSP20 family protein|nr:hypothetical protein [Parcubacteria group bacterium]MDP6119443.1 Hsp20/alpha crystallin family protein [Candidatus Paceibacterota bacterium]HJN62679.1 Hsp20/alpha crystallin family protein [Candidatus Paceibacterota bacterium]|tara:strand:- start:58 stop:564 length:507 start_codon:yes stop_codon:yes gene_type:complete